MGSIVRIGITGSHGTGKTTLAVALADRLKLPLIQEQAREVAKALEIKNMKLLKYNPDLGASFQRECLNCQLDAEKSLQGGFVSDRTTIDNATYWLKNNAHRCGSVANNFYFKKAFDNVRNYNLVIYVPPEIAPEDDGFRDTDRNGQLEIDLYIRAFLALTAPNYITVRGTLEERVDRVLQELHGCMAGRFKHILGVR